MKKVKEEKVALAENMKSLLARIDFYDVFSTTNHFNDIQEITNMVFNTTPKWIEKLFLIRNRIVKIFGLKTELPADYNEKFEVGGYVKYFKIFSIRDNEVILGANDPHLNFRAIIKNENTEQYNIRVTTLVEYNNLKGKVYMRIIKPFHRIVVMRMVQNAYYQNIKSSH